MRHLPLFRLLEEQGQVWSTSGNYDMKKHKIVVCVLAAFMMSGACAKDESTETESKKVSAGETENNAKETKKSAVLFAGTNVLLPEEVAMLRFGSAEAEALKELGQDSNLWFSRVNDDVSYTLEVRDGIVAGIKIKTKKDLDKVLGEAWGTPYLDKDGVAFWFNPKEKLRAFLPKVYEGEAVTIQPYQPFEDFLGKSGFALAFAKDKALLGATVEEFRDAWGRQLCRFAKQGLPIQDAYIKYLADSKNKFPPPYKNEIEICWMAKRGLGIYSNDDSVTFAQDGGVDSLSISIETGGSTKYVAKIVAILDAKFGTATILPTESNARYYFDAESQRKVEVTIGEQSIYLGYMAYMPLETLFGGSGPGLGIEPKSAFGTYEEIAKEDPDHYRSSHGSLASLFYPGTEFSYGLTELSLWKTPGDKKVSKQKLVLHYIDNPELGERILGLLEKKFGAPVPSKRKTDDGRYINFKTKKRKVEVWQVEEQLQITITK